MHDRRKRVNWLVQSTRVSAGVNLLFAAGKFFLGIYTLSLFLCTNGIYNLGISLVKLIPIRGYRRAARSQAQETQAQRNLKEEYRRYRQMGVTLLITSAIYLGYCIQMLITRPAQTRYGTIVAISIATVTFTEIGLAVRGFLVMRNNKEPLMEGLKLTGLATSLISLVLTQSAITSFAEPNETNAILGCAVTGVLFGTVSLLIGLYMILHGAGKIAKIEEAENECETLTE